MLVFVILIQIHLLDETGDIVLKKLLSNTPFKIILTAVVIILASISIVYFMNSRISGEEYPVEEDDIRIAAVGDSITNGLYITNWPEGNYPNQLDSLLGEGFGVVNFGVNNHTAQVTADHPYYHTETYEQRLDFEPHTVIFMLGTNDAKKYNWLDGERFKRQYVELLNTYQESPSVSRIILASPATAFVDPAENVYDPENVQKITQIIEDVAVEQDLEYVDVNELTSSNPEWYVSDGIHLNGEGAMTLARAFHEQLITE